MLGSDVSQEKNPTRAGRPRPCVVVMQLTGVVREINLHRIVGYPGDDTGECFSLLGLRGLAFYVEVITGDAEVVRRGIRW